MVRARLRAVVCACLLAGGCAPRSSVLAAPTLEVPVGRVVGSGPLTSATEEPGPDDGRSAGDLVEVEWKGSWWPAVLLERRAAGWLIHYDAYDDAFDEVVGASRIRDRAAVEDEPDDPLDEEPDP